MPWTTRMYRDEQDLIRIRALVAANFGAGFVEEHVGDLNWGIYKHADFDPSQSIRICEDEDGALLGYVWLDVPAPSYLFWATWPNIDAAATVEEELFGWGEAQRRALFASDAPDRSLSLYVLDGNASRKAFVIDHGFTRTDDFMYHFKQRLDRTLPETVLPAGWTIRPVGDQEEWLARVEVHRDVWHPSRVTLDAYQRLRGAPGYDPRLDLVAVSPDGEFGAYCICWLDEQNQCGEFEPVGTRAKFRGMGLGKAIITEGLRRMQDLGALSAIVYTPPSNEPAVKLYLSSGFQIVDQQRSYVKQL